MHCDEHWFAAGVEVTCAGGTKEVVMCSDENIQRGLKSVRLTASVLKNIGRKAQLTNETVMDSATSKLVKEKSIPLLDSCSTFQPMFGNANVVLHGRPHKEDTTLKQYKSRSSCFVFSINMETEVKDDLNQYVLSPLSVEKGGLQKLMQTKKRGCVLVRCTSTPLPSFVHNKKSHEPEAHHEYTVFRWDAGWSWKFCFLHVPSLYSTTAKAASRRACSVIFGGMSQSADDILLREFCPTYDFTVNYTEGGQRVLKIDGKPYKRSVFAFMTAKVNEASIPVVGTSQNEGNCWFSFKACVQCKILTNVCVVSIDIGAYAGIVNFFEAIMQLKKSHLKSDKKLGEIDICRGIQTNCVKDIAAKTTVLGFVNDYSVM